MILAKFKCDCINKFSSLCKFIWAAKWLPIELKPVYINNWSSFQHCTILCWLIHHTNADWSDQCARAFKVHIFWEGHIILRNLHLTFDWHFIGQNYGEDFESFVAFSEYMNFMKNIFTIADSWSELIFVSYFIHIEFFYSWYLYMIRLGKLENTI